MNPFQVHLVVPIPGGIRLVVVSRHISAARAAAMAARVGGVVFIAGPGE